MLRKTFSRQHLVICFLLFTENTLWRFKQSCLFRRWFVRNAKAYSLGKKKEKYRQFVVARRAVKAVHSLLKWSAPRKKNRDICDLVEITLRIRTIWSGSFISLSISNDFIRGNQRLEPNTPTRSICYPHVLKKRFSCFCVCVGCGNGGVERAF